MKKLKYLIFILPLFILLMMMSSCGFVKYVDVSTNATPNDTELKTIETEKRDYCIEIENLSYDSAYNEKERSLYMDYLVEAKSEINECNTIEEIKEVYDKYSKLIINLKTTKQYETELKDMKDKYINLINSVSSEDNYREDELVIYKECIAKATNLFNSLTKAQEDIFKQIYEIYKEAILKIKTNKEYEIEEKELLDEQNKYIDLLKEVSSIDLYREKEQKLYEFYLDAGIKAIQDETHKDNIKTIYESYKDIILSIKTDEDYKIEEAKALAKYKEDNINIINNHIDLSLYREAEVNSITEILNEYTALINESTTNKEIDDLVVDYKIKVYPYKTDKELYDEELKKLINDSINEIKNYKNTSNYRENEVLIINSIIDTFSKQVVVLLDKELVNQLVESYKQILDSIKDDKTLYEEERVELVNESYEELLTLVDLSNMTEEAQQDYLDYCLSVKNEMLKLETKELIKSRLLSEKQNMYLLGAKLGDKNSLMELQELLVDDLYNYLDMDLYREEQQSEILTIINTQGKIVKKQETYDSTLSSIDDTHLLLDEVLTNDEMWEKEDEEFFVTLHELYGDDILTPPASMTEANDYYELAKIIDYYAFYQLDGSSFVRNKFRVKLNFNFDNEDSAKLNTYWKCELVHVNCGLLFSSEDGYLLIELIAYDTGSLTNNVISINKKNQDSVYGDETLIPSLREKENFAFASKKQLKGLWNTNQLWYALENDYYPICIPNSPADISLNKMVDILNDINTDNMSDEKKLFNIYSWIGNNVTFNNYFFTDIEYNNSSNLEIEPDEIPALYQETTLEGALINGYAVCYGFAKLELSMLKIEGIDAKLIYCYANNDAMKSTINWLDNGRVHCVCLVNINNTWFYSDASNSNTSNGRSIQYPLYDHMIYFYEINNNYSYRNTQMNNIIVDNVCKQSSIYDNILRNINVNGISIFVEDYQQFEELIQQKTISIISRKNFEEFLYNNYSNTDYIIIGTLCGNSTLYTYILLYDD